ncbi:MAG: M56 family metallopeptidase [Lawsonibacter sp.]|nr:M56 family metallopeptidase [Lawsonibacter sp.]
MPFCCYFVDSIASTFVMGLFCPRIYLPSTLSEMEQAYIIRHEQQHIRRGDHVIRILVFLTLCIHWFIPLVWFAFSLVGMPFKKLHPFAVKPLNRMKARI